MIKRKKGAVSGDWALARSILYRRSIAMGRRLVLICLVGRLTLMTLSVSCLSVGVDASDLFTIRSISVDSEADDANTARKLALADGQERALKMLLKKLTLDADHDRLPVVEGSQLGDFVQGFEIANEQRSERRYLADVTVRFEPYAVRALLWTAGIPFAESVSAPIVVLPVFQSDGVTKLWDDPNPWRDAWRRFELQEGLVDLVIPIGELVDLAAINSGQALNGNRPALRDFAAGHGADEALVTVAKLEFDANGVPIVDVTMQRYGSVVGPLRVERFTGGSEEGIGALLSASVSKMAARIEYDWKLENLLAFDEKEDMIIIIPIKSLQHWLRLRSGLGKLAVIRETKLLSLSRNEALMRVFYLGSVDRLVSVLAQRGLDLLLSDGRWTLVEQGSLDSEDSDQRRAGIDNLIEAGATEQVVEELPALESEKVMSPPTTSVSPAPLNDLLVE